METSYLPTPPNPSRDVPRDCSALPLKIRLLRITGQPPSLCFPGGPQVSRPGQPNRKGGKGEAAINLAQK